MSALMPFQLKSRLALCKVFSYPECPAIGSLYTNRRTWAFSWGNCLRSILCLYKRRLSRREYLWLSSSFLYHLLNSSLSSSSCWYCCFKSSTQMAVGIDNRDSVISSFSHSFRESASTTLFSTHFLYSTAKS
jgi:hypothetical protein